MNVNPAVHMFAYQEHNKLNIQLRVKNQKSCFIFWLTTDLNMQYIKKPTQLYRASFFSQFL